MQFEPTLVIRVYFILFIQSEYYDVYIIYVNIITYTFQGPL